MEGDEENNKQRMIERVVSQKALALSSSFPCQICVVGFLSGVCLTSLFLAALTSFGSFTFGSSSSSMIWPWNSSSSTASPIFNMITTGGSSNVKMGAVVKTNVSIGKRNEDLLYSAWSLMLNQSVGQGEVTGKAEALKNLGLSSITNIPKAPHLENCKLRAEVNQRLDRRGDNSSLFPPWTIWKGLLDLYPAAATSELDSQLKDNLRNQDIAQGAYPPWVTGSDGENYPLTRKVQRDIWLHQHPVNCHDPQVKFIVADWERPPGFGIGAQIAGICGLLAIAIKEKRVLVTNYYNRADHDDCKGSARASWSCYFFPETSQECRDRALELMQQKEAWDKGIITGKDNYTSKEIWAGRTPRTWGEPWHYLQPTTEINGSFVAFHRKMDRRWWRAQAVRYLMRFPTEYTCQLLNLARHMAFGRQAAKMVLASYNGQWPKEEPSRDTTEIEKYVWSSHKPWIPRPLLSIHVRMGDKACEMNVVGFEEYMSLADRMRKRFPQLNSIWLSTEMQEVIDRTRLYPNWNFYFSDVKRQVGNITMASYEASLGRKTSTNYPFVNFLMATEADLFIGALGSTWCFLIDGMRNTGGKVMAGYVSVNKDRFW